MVLPHGGPESYARINFDWLAQAMANQGYLVIQPQFRASIGFGLAHKQAGHWLVSYWEKLLAKDETSSKGLAVISPVNFADKCSAPTLLIRGENEQVVRIQQSESMYSKLKSHNKNVKFVIPKDENHHLQNPAERLKALQEIMSFLDKHIAVAQP